MAAESNVMLPERAGTRSEVRNLLASLPEDLTDAQVRVDGAVMAATAPSFIDELVKQVLVERNAGTLLIVNLTDRPAGYALASAQRRGVDTRLTIRTRRH
jgi:hypothetical protein